MQKPLCSGNCAIYRRWRVLLGEVWRVEQRQLLVKQEVHYRQQSPDQGGAERALSVVTAQRWQLGIKP